MHGPNKLSPKSKTTRGQARRDQFSQSCRTDQSHKARGWTEERNIAGGMPHYFSHIFALISKGGHR